MLRHYAVYDAADDIISKLDAAITSFEKALFGVGGTDAHDPALRRANSLLHLAYNAKSYPAGCLVKDKLDEFKTKIEFAKYTITGSTTIKAKPLFKSLEILARVDYCYSELLERLPGTLKMSDYMYDFMASAVPKPVATFHPKGGAVLNVWRMDDAAILDKAGTSGPALLSLVAGHPHLLQCQIVMQYIPVGATPTYYPMPFGAPPPINIIQCVKTRLVKTFPAGLSIPSMATSFGYLNDPWGIAVLGEMPSPKYWALPPNYPTVGHIYSRVGYWYYDAPGYFPDIVISLDWIYSEKLFRTDVFRTYFQDPVTKAVLGYLSWGIKIDKHPEMVSVTWLKPSWVDFEDSDFIFQKCMGSVDAVPIADRRSRFFKKDRFIPK